ncbi:hypothetical protein IMCC12053_530 [Celeribacter marinus]|uniref:Uncharacterized protein n=1 Tax=Celeribacter marinus TaxID=1397108 RepID=A0A0N9ZMF5_9RHOB|nr:hypothetical protein IMCC12053_530 [Celeribacter marinus]
MRIAAYGAANKKSLGGAKALFDLVIYYLPVELGRLMMKC